MSYLKFLLFSVSGLFSLANFGVYLAIVISTGEFGLPSPNTLFEFGAKDPVAIANGEWWRIFTSIFLHIGPLHLAMNTYAIRAIGPQIEETVGPWLFTVIYLISGMVGSIASGVFSLSISAGASGAIMGLLGFGLVIESLAGFRLKQQNGSWPRMGSYLINTLFIIAFGLFVPNIDNAAHIGGLVSGAAVGTAILLVRRNRLIRSNYPLAAVLVFSVISFAAFGTSRISDKKIVLARLISAGDQSEEPGEKVFFYTRALEIDSQSASAFFKRGQALLSMDELDYAMFDFTAALKDPGLIPDFRGLIEELEKTPGKEVEVFRLNKLIENID